jgi:hypothetical protein
MSLTHAVIFTGHEDARVLHFDAEHIRKEKIHSSTHYTRQHSSKVRTEHEFFGEVCDAVGKVDEVLVTGTHMAIAAFRHYAEKHRPHVAAHIVGYEAVDRPTDPQLVALARQYFLKADRMKGVSNPFGAK